MCEGVSECLSEGGSELFMSSYHHYALFAFCSIAPRSGLSWKHHIDVGGNCIHKYD